MQLQEILSQKEVKLLNKLRSSDGVLEQGDGKPNLTNAESQPKEGTITPPDESN